MKLFLKLLKIVLLYNIDNIKTWLKTQKTQITLEF